MAGKGEHQLSFNNVIPGWMIAALPWQRFIANAREKLPSDRIREDGWTQGQLIGSELAHGGDGGACSRCLLGSLVPDPKSPECRDKSYTELLDIAREIYGVARISELEERARAAFLDLVVDDGTAFAPETPAEYYDATCSSAEYISGLNDHYKFTKAKALVLLEACEL
jgi:hypothetical protein